MSWGSVIGAVAGGIIGFILGGPTGAYYGASMGFAIGMYVDPMTPDVTAAGAPDTSELVMSGEVGTPVFDLAGTGKIIGHLLCYGGEHAEAEEEEIEAGKGGGGSESYITGYKYYMSWAVGIAVGQVDTLLAVYENDDVVWEGELACPASGGQETITLDGMGSATFYFGTNDQALNSKVGNIIDDASLNIPYRNLCWCFLDDCYIGNYNRAPSLSFIIKKVPQYAFSDKHDVGRYDCNPAHLMWYILHDLAGLSESWLHSADFAEMATTLLSESRGLSVAFSAQQSAIGYLESINNHVDSILRYGVDGKFHPKLIREDYVAEDLPLIDEGVMIEEPVLKRKSWIDTINEMKVQYTKITGGPQGGALWGAGDNQYGALGTGESIIYPEFIELDITGHLSLTCGKGHSSLVIRASGELWGAGENDFGQLGIGGGSQDYFVQISNEVWLGVSGGDNFTLFLKKGGYLWVSGKNDKGQLGLGSHDNQPVMVYCTSSVAAMGAGTYHSMIVTVSGVLKGTGYNSPYCLGVGDNNERTSFTQEVLGDSDWGSVACGLMHSMALKRGGTLYGTGNNFYGQTGVDIPGDTVYLFTQEVHDYRWQKVSCGDNFTIALNQDGSIWGAGENTHYYLGLGDTTNRRSLTRIGSDHDWVDIECGIRSSMAIKSDGSLWGWGLNSNYELGLGHNNEVQTPTDLSMYALCIGIGRAITLVVKVP